MADAGERIRLKLYVTGRTARSEQALANLRHLCSEVLPPGCDIVIVDVLQQPHLAEAASIVVTPTLVKESPVPELRVLGDLSDHEQVLGALQLHHELAGNEEKT